MLLSLLLIINFMSPHALIKDVVWNRNQDFKTQWLNSAQINIAWHIPPHDSLIIEAQGFITSVAYRNVDRISPNGRTYTQKFFVSDKPNGEKTIVINTNLKPAPVLVMECKYYIVLNVYSENKKGQKIYLDTSTSPVYESTVKL